MKRTIKEKDYYKKKVIDKKSNDKQPALVTSVSKKALSLRIGGCFEKVIETIGFLNFKHRKIKMK